MHCFITVLLVNVTRRHRNCGAVLKMTAIKYYHGRGNKRLTVLSRVVARECDDIIQRLSANRLALLFINRKSGKFSDHDIIVFLPDNANQTTIDTKVKKNLKCR